MFKSISARIAVLFLLLVLLPLVILGAWFSLQNYKSLTKQLIARHQHEALYHGGEVRERLAAFVRDLELLSDILSLQGGGDAHKFVLLKSLQMHQPLFVELSHIDNKGEQLFIRTLQENIVLENVTDAGKILAEVKERQQPVCAIIQQSNYPQTLLSISTPVFFLNNTFVNGAVSAQVNFSSLTMSSKQHKDIEDIQIGLYLPNGRKISGDLFEIPPSVSLPAIFKETTASKGLIVADRLLGICPIEFYGSRLYVVMNSELKSVLSSFYHSLNLLIAIIFLVFIASLFTGLFFAKKLLTIPLLSLSHAAREIGKGDLTKRVDLSGDDEFSELANTFNGMAERLEESLKSLERESAQRKNAEEEAHQAMILAQQANEAKSMFLANMSHEIRTPINGIMGMTTLMLNSGLSNEQQYRMELVNRSINRLLSIISVILDFSKIESGDVVLEESTFATQELVEDALQIARLEVNNQQIRFATVISENVPGKLLADSGKIHQVLLNLLSNAVKYTSVGEIIVTVDCFAASGGSCQLQICVSDTGEGIPESARESIFDPFIQANETRKTSARRGAGLGLAICEKFVIHMGGNIWFEENKPLGSSFYFTCQCKDVEEGNAQREGGAIVTGKADMHDSLAGISIYIAEDEFINQHMLSSYLKEMAADIVVCNNGQELLDQVQVKEPDIILMDIRMPVMGGLEATERIRAAEKKDGKRHVPIIALTAHATLEFKEKCFAAGMDHYLTKPIELAKMVRHILDLHRKHSNIC